MSRSKVKDVFDSSHKTEYNPYIVTIPIGYNGQYRFRYQMASYPTSDKIVLYQDVDDECRRC